MFKKRCTINRDSCKFNFNNFLNKNRFSKKGQITLFIIVGMLLLLAVILILSLKSELVVLNVGEIVPTEKGKITNYLSSCLDEIGDDALFLVGLQAGYIEVPELLSADYRTHLAISPMHTLPYWAYGNTVEIPPLEMIKDEIDTYIEENMRDCLYELEPFQEEYDLIENGEISSDTEIVSNKVLFNVHWDIEVRNKGGELVTEIINHVSESDVKLKTVYELAKNIMEKEIESLKLEDIAQDLIALEHPEVPLVGIELSCQEKTWDKVDVKENLMNMLRINIRELKVKGTSFVEFPEELTYYQNHYIWDIGEEVNNDKVSVLFNFDDTYPYQFAVNPSTKTKLSSSSQGGSDLLSFLCIQNWKFSYDLVFPVKVTVVDETTGYQFNIAFTAHLVRNIPYRGEVEEKESFLIDFVDDEDYCMTARVPMTIKTYEAVDNNMGVSYQEDLGNVNLTFSCLTSQCEMGQTEYDFGGLGYAGVNTVFPYCAGGILRAKKEGYKETWQRIVTEVDEIVELDLVPLHKVSVNKINVVQHELQGEDEEGNFMFGSEGALSDDETVLLTISYDPENYTFTKIPFSNKFHEENIIFSSELDENTTSQMYLEFLGLADYTYNLELTTLDSEGNIVGGYKGNWTVPWSLLEPVEEIVFHTVHQNNPTEMEMFDMMAMMDEMSLQLPIPELSDVESGVAEE